MMVNKMRKLLYYFVNKPKFCKKIIYSAVIVGTLDGKLSALNADGSMIWNVDTGPGPLLISNIHKLEVI